MPAAAHFRPTFRCVRHRAVDLGHCCRNRLRSLPPPPGPKRTRSALVRWTTPSTVHRDSVTVFLFHPDRTPPAALRPRRYGGLPSIARRLPAATLGRVRWVFENTSYAPH